MTPTGALTLALTSAAALSGGYFLMRRSAASDIVARAGSSVLTLITPVIDMGVAEMVLSALDQVSGDKVTVLLHTQGGCVASCVMIAQALRHFRESTVVVPYMAISGGTLIALSARHLQMGRNAYLSAVDPIVYGERAKYLTAPDDARLAADTRLAALARDYEVAVLKYMRTTLTHRVRWPDATREQLDGRVDMALDVFMGKHAPHEWPIPIQEVLALGIPVTPASRGWAAQVDAQRRAW